MKDQEQVDLTGKQQHGCKKNKSTTTLGLKFQALLARALDENNYALMASLDLSAAFDVVNTKLLNDLWVIFKGFDSLPFSLF